MLLAPGDLAARGLRGDDDDGVDKGDAVLMVSTLSDFEPVMKRK